MKCTSCVSHFFEKATAISCSHFTAPTHLRHVSSSAALPLPRIPRTPRTRKVLLSPNTYVSSLPHFIFNFYLFILFRFVLFRFVSFRFVFFRFHFRSRSVSCSFPPRTSAWTRQRLHVPGSFCCFLFPPPPLCASMHFVFCISSLDAYLPVSWISLLYSI
jgi:hypothetical protein